MPPWNGINAASLRITTIAWNVCASCAGRWVASFPRPFARPCRSKKTEWFSNYGKSLANYMMDIAELPEDPSDPQESLVMDLTVHQRPPKEYFIDVRFRLFGWFHISNRHKYLSKDLRCGETSFDQFHLPPCWRCGILFDRSIDRLIDWLIDWLIESSVDWLIDWLFHRSIDWWIDWLIDWLVFSFLLEFMVIIG